MQSGTMSLMITAGICCNLWCLYKIWRSCKQPSRPFRIYLLRHGESEGNIDQNLFQFVPDHAIPLTMNGLLQAEQAGRALKDMIGDERVRFWVSPYQRTRQTFQMVSQPFDNDKMTWREEPRLREQDWGNFQDGDIIEECRRLRTRFGSFFYRIPAGESGADVFDRVSNFLESLFRDFSSNPTPNVVIISHGLTCRLFLMRFLHWPFEKFERTRNLSNCQILILERQEDSRYKLITPIEEDDAPIHDEWDQFAQLKSLMLTSKSAAARAPTSFDVPLLSAKHRRLITNLI